ncbi:phage minor capsid protein [Paenibacillus sp. GM2]|uniref:phage minor capsid protein n=1 Tax=Paenibacillus sp. GM2 TaxID=1622070 RepID=UPI000838A494|nr:phage minor capsid protein [Paenibacillus sp. GM2]
MAKDPYSLREVFEEMTFNLIASLKRNLSRHEREEERVGFRFDQWQLAKLRNLKWFRKKNKEIIQGTSKTADQMVEEVLQQSFKFGEDNVEIVAEKVVKASGELEFPKDFKPKQPSKPPPADPSRPIPDMDRPIPEPPKPHSELPKAPQESDFFGMNDKKLKALQGSVKDDLHDASDAVLRKMDDIYRQVIFKAEAHMAAGVLTLDQAIDKATKDFLERGLDVIVYSDGRRVPITYYAEMALRTASQRATFLGEGKKRDEWGIYTVVMSSHDNCSPWCSPFQGTVLIDDVYTSISKEQAEQLSRDTGYLLLSYAMEQGAFHPACRHTLATYFPGITQLPKPADPDVVEANYQAEQKQRYMENTIRKYKRLEVGSLDEANQIKYGAKVTEWQNRLGAHLAENPQLRRDRRRTKIDGEVPASERKQLLKNAEVNDKIEEVRKHIRSDEVPKHLHMGHQGKHIKGHNNYIEGKSYLTISADEAQELVSRYAGTGAINMTKKGEWKNQELIDSDTIVGKAIDQFTGEEFETKLFKIHYGKKGVHIVPTKRGEG